MFVITLMRINWTKEAEKAIKCAGGFPGEQLTTVEQDKEAQCEPPRATKGGSLAMKEVGACEMRLSEESSKDSEQGVRQVNLSYINFSNICISYNYHSRTRIYNIPYSLYCLMCVDKDNSPILYSKSHLLFIKPLTDNRSTDTRELQSDSSSDIEALLPQDSTSSVSGKENGKTSLTLQRCRLSWNSYLVLFLTRGGVLVFGVVILIAGGVLSQHSLSQYDNSTDCYDRMNVTFDY